MKCIKDCTFSEGYPQKNTTGKFTQIMNNVNWRLIGLTVVLQSNFIMIRFGSPERDYSISKGDMTLQKGLGSQHSKDIQLHDSLGLPKSSKWIWTSYNLC